MSRRSLSKCVSFDWHVKINVGVLFIFHFLGCRAPRNGSSDNNNFPWRTDAILSKHEMRKIPREIRIHFIRFRYQNSRASAIRRSSAHEMRSKSSRLEENAGIVVAERNFPITIILVLVKRDLAYHPTRNFHLSVAFLAHVIHASVPTWRLNIILPDESRVSSANFRVFHIACQ